MRQIFRSIPGVVLTLSLAGCGESQPESGPVPFKATTSPAIDGLKENMANAAKGSTYTKKPTDVTKTDAKAAPAPAKEAEKKP
jgi:predicted small lipoprotein YifL